jgi:hypothetical protein
MRKAGEKKYVKSERISITEVVGCIHLAKRRNIISYDDFEKFIKLAKEF